MALIKCGECNQDVSGKAPSCPHCGYPFWSTSQFIRGSQTSQHPESWYYSNWFIIVLFGFSMVLGTFAWMYDKNKFIFSEDKSSEVNIYTDGSKIYSTEYNNLWGHEFYTSKIDQSGSVDIGSVSKQRIAKLLNSLSFPPRLTQKLLFVHVDPTITKPNDKVKIPWAGGDASIALQPQGGSYQKIYGGSVIALNNLISFNHSLLTHELGHIIGSELTNEEWKQYYKLRNIPSDASWDGDWKLSPGEDFAEVYKAVYISSPVMTQYGLLVPASIFEIETPCFEMASKIEQEYIKKNSTPTNISGFGTISGELREKAKDATTRNSEVQSCRRANNKPDSFLGEMLYINQLDDATVKFIKNIINRLNN